ncbi:hypothetical protein ANANG_G00103390 [Anguilla anguilla]|uniref:Uncharacterized protein n=1 Tax=Anguilla anguilla TaxID=7936 RepID=A0A9D3MIV0_ANGAN|nr:hypothetical protein ANANG_G00103390 [Anguilla anguilla]
MCGERSGAKWLPCMTQVDATHWWWFRAVRGFLGEAVEFGCVAVPSQDLSLRHRSH